ncbi:4-fold beta flower protein [Mesorhizobium sp. AaZ16]|uniref:4-fold beta flower protein n=1 Tax=Mesorhizobium sp. AaZ16 TaxID=3402289 RepID=UPI00374E8290
MSAIGNGFILHALCRVARSFPDLGAIELAHEYARAFQVVNRGGNDRPWFTFIGEDGFLWLDEYPADDGYPTRVLNGHIHALFGLQVYATSTLCETSAAIVDGAITTMRHHVLEFRRPGKINRYSLREPTKKDYLPERTVRQQLELFKLTRDKWFFEAARMFRDDIREARKGAVLEFFSSDGQASLFIADSKVYRWDGTAIGVVADGVIHDTQGRFVGWVKHNTLLNSRGERCFVTPQADRSDHSVSIFMRPPKGAKQRAPAPLHKERPPVYPGQQFSWAADPFIEAASRYFHKPRRSLVRRVLGRLRRILLPKRPSQHAR